MSPRAAYPAACAALAAAVLLAGCGQGDIVALPAPGGATEWPLDPHWLALSPLAGEDELLDVDWRPGPAGADSGRAVIVGERGVALWREGARWHREDTGTEADLLDVALVDDTGTALAVGGAGTAMRRDAARWRREDTGTAADLRRLVRGGDAWWAVGAGGAVLRREGGAWSDLSAPTTAGLVSAAVHEGALYAGADDGALWRLDEDGWRAVAAPWDTLFAAGLAVTGRGDLFALADSLYRLAPEGWTAIEGAHWLPGRSAGWRMLAAGDSLFVATGSEILRVLPYAAEPAFAWAASIGQGAAVAGSRLVTVGDRQIEWRDPGDTRPDPAGLMRYLDWVTFGDGSCALHSSNGMWVPDRHGLHAVAGYADMRVDGSRAWLLAGESADVLLGAFHDDVIRRRVDGAWSVVAPCEDRYDVTGLVLDAQGRCLMATDRGLGRWNGSGWDWVLGRADDGPDISTARHFIRRGGAGDLLAWDGRGMVYRERDGDWHVLAETDEVSWVVQDAAGDVYIIGISYSVGYDPVRTITVARPGAGQVRVYGDETLGVLEGRRFGGVADRGGDVLVWTRDPEMVYRLAGSAGALDWELVAGVLPAEINGLGVLDDGSLVAAARTGVVYHYRRP